MRTPEPSFEDFLRVMQRFTSASPMQQTASQTIGVNLSIEEADAGLRTTIAAELVRIQGCLTGIANSPITLQDLRLHLRVLNKNIQLSRDLMASVPAMIVIGTHIQLHHTYVSGRLNSLEKIAELLVQLESVVSKIQQQADEVSRLELVRQANSQVGLLTSFIESV